MENPRCSDYATSDVVSALVNETVGSYRFSCLLKVLFAFPLLHLHTSDVEDINFKLVWTQPDYIRGSISEQRGLASYRIPMYFQSLLYLYI